MEDEVRAQEKPQIMYEWVVFVNKGEDIILTENQFEVYKSQVQTGDTRQLFFNDVGMNPAYVTSFYKRPAQYIRNKYPCPVCHMGGRNADNSGWCPSCKGSGVQLPKKP